MAQVKGIVRNTGFNLLGQGIPLLIGAASIPIIARSLRVEAFGLLGLAWLVLGYTSLFELGLGRATIKNVSALIGKEEYESLPAVIWTPFWIQLALGTLGAIFVWVLAPVIVRLMNPSGPYVIELLRWLGIALPIILMTSIFRSALEGAQHFGIVNLLKGINLTAMFVIPLVGSMTDWRLIDIVAVMAKTQLIVFIAYGVVIDRRFRALRRASVRPRANLLRPLFSFGGWTTVYQGCLLVSHVDRLLLGAFVSLGALAYYTAAKEIISRVWIVPWSLGLVLFPTFSGLDASGGQKEIKRLYHRASMFLMAIMAPVPVLAIFLTRPLLELYLGGDYAQNATVPLQILAAGLAINSLSFAPYSLFQGLGRPDIPAKIGLILAPVHLGLLVFLVPSFGAMGAALSWSIWGSIAGITMALIGWRTVRAL